MVPRTTSMQRATPWEQYHSRKINSKTNLKAAFEDCAEAHRNIIDNTMKSGASGCLALYDTGNVDGTWYIFCIAMHIHIHLRNTQQL